MGKINGRIHKLGDNIDTDVIIPARYLNTAEPSELAKHCLEGLDQGYPERIGQGDILVAGANFGCGSSREHAPIALKTCGLACIIASSFARIFFRNSINIGLPVLESTEAAVDIGQDEIVEVDLVKGIIFNKSKNKKYTAMPYPAFMLDIIGQGGLVNFTKRQLSSEERKY